jgi:RNA polymerase sigma factor (sigma-70 family)
VIRDSIPTITNKQSFKKSQQFQLKHPGLFQNWIIRKFFEETGHIHLLDVVEEESLEIWGELEQSFKHFFFDIRFTKYLRSIIKFGSIDLDRKRHQVAVRQLLILDNALNKENDAIFGEMLLSKRAYISSKTDPSSPEMFQESFHDETIYLAFATLTEKQKLITMLSYSLCYMDTEIATVLHITQQAVFKNRTTALNKMRINMNLKERGMGKRKN